MQEGRPPLRLACRRRRRGRRAAAALSGRVPNRNKEHSMQVGRAPIRLACMSLMWGQGNLPNERVQPWLNDVVQAGYEGVACFEGELLRFLRDLPFAASLQQLGLELASVDFIIDRDFDRLRRVCEAM